MRDFFGKLCSTLIITVLVLYAGCVFVKQEIQLKELESEKEQYRVKLDEAIMETEARKETREKINTNEYIEEYAREKLGLVMPNEIIFVDASV